MNKIPSPFPVVKILSESDAIDIVNKDPNKYNVVSIWSGGGGKHGNERPEHRNAKTLCQQRFHDINCTEWEAQSQKLILCSKWHIKTILDYAKTKYNEPLIIHCHAGISRSSAITFLILLDYYKNKSENPIDISLEHLNAVKHWSQIIPNKHIISLGIHILAKNAGQEMEWNRTLYNHCIFAKYYN